MIKTSLRVKSVQVKIRVRTWHETDCAVGNFLFAQADVVLHEACDKTTVQSHGPSQNSK